MPPQPLMVPHEEAVFIPLPPIQAESVSTLPLAYEVKVKNSDGSVGGIGISRVYKFNTEKKTEKMKELGIGILYISDIDWIMVDYNDYRYIIRYEDFLKMINRKNLEWMYIRSQKIQEKMDNISWNWYNKDGTIDRSVEVEVKDVTSILKELNELEKIILKWTQQPIHTDDNRVPYMLVQERLDNIHIILNLPKDQTLNKQQIWKLDDTKRLDYYYRIANKKLLQYNDNERKKLLKKLKEQKKS